MNLDPVVMVEGVKAPLRQHGPRLGSLTDSAASPRAYSGHADQRFRSNPITRSGACRTPDDDAGGGYFAGFFPLVKLSALRIDSPPSMRR